MKRTLTVFLIAITVLGASPMTAQAKPRIPCTGKRVKWLRPALGVNVIEHRVLSLLIPCVYTRYGPPPASLQTVRCIARRESHGYPAALNPSGSAGVFQIVNWQERVKVWLHKRWFPGKHRTPSWAFIRGPLGWSDARANSIMAVRMMVAVGLSPWSGGAYAC